MIPQRSATSNIEIYTGDDKAIDETAVKVTLENQQAPLHHRTDVAEEVENDYLESQPQNSIFR